ncbi:hypothetical protein B0T19DRAFT_413740 [Cercophora scortea]|uniref:Tat pathway signal sequence n=1 Tax=Cercophora scortea TaxID=314031 RepID=A0AAE0IUY0_9PEZI|nr:hypothetical protein B0T19DRAFT_413740 [Cercophora scortea]
MLTENFLRAAIPSLKDALKYDERSEWTRGMHNPWNLPPSDELDEAWKDLLYPLNLRVSGTELDLVGENRTNAARVTGGDYLGVMGVYHNLHCLNALRVQLHWDYYEAKSLKLSKIASNVSISGHIAHCIDSIRQALTCHPNMAVAVSDYVNDPSFYVSEDVRNSATVQCVNWDSLHGWAKQRALVAGEYKFLPGPWHKSPDAKNPKDW